LEEVRSVARSFSLSTSSGERSESDFFGAVFALFAGGKCESPDPNPNPGPDPGVSSLGLLVVGGSMMFEIERKEEEEEEEEEEEDPFVLFASSSSFFLFEMMLLSMLLIVCLFVWSCQSIEIIIIAIMFVCLDSPDHHGFGGL